ncbi:transmembrane protein [Alicycliphilus sp. B1]|nr:transmembrane protein [Alicycliphilus sp. B1]
MAESGTQRHYRAPCPGCGAPVEFRSAQSTHAVCPYCHSTVVRSGEVLRRAGRMAEVFDDHSPLRLMASGRFEGQPFTLIGRLQYKGDEGGWTEWIAWLQDGSTATLSEDNGAYVFMRPAALGREPPDAARLRVGVTTAVDGKPFSVAANLRAQLVAAEGELPRLPPPGQPFQVVELRSGDGEVLAIDYGSSPPQVQRGRAVRLEDLQMQGLKDESAREEKGRQFNCPHCGAPVQVQLATTKSCTCPACNSLIDLSAGVGGELRHAVQHEPVAPLIPLGSVGQFEGASWQAVGFQHRMGREPGDDEEFGWDEYLLYNARRGFVFLVDASDGWSLVRPATGAPQYKNGAQTASYLGTQYRLASTYTAETDYVLGEFYWPVERGQKTSNADFAATGGRGLLSREQSRGEVTWSHGERIDSSAVAQAFRLGDKAALFRRQDAGPVAGNPGIGCSTLILAAVVLLVLLVLMSNCAGSSGGGYRSSGGSFGGYTSGGGHK